MKEIKEFYDKWDLSNAPRYIKILINYADSLIREEIKDKVEGFILDAGTGFGAFYDILKDKEVIYLDISLNLLKKHKGDKKICANLYYLPFKNNCFDTVLCINVLEHLDLKVVDELLRVLKPNGKLIIVGINRDSIIKEEIFNVFPIYHKPISIKDFKNYKIVYKKSFYFVPSFFKIIPFLDKFLFRFWKRIDKFLSKYSMRGEYIILIIEKEE